ncbi:unnamed protein product [Cuscuta epithymum]|uniref:Uncharacterized protein n=1 Tax=Cuscuta epithymum TaxID=186058 RepID=A0AAV0BZ69_9ASTE|nr:unnamed protein product [Cuscuta epithymum]
MGSKWLISEGSSSGGGKHASSFVRLMQEMHSDGAGESTQAGMWNSMNSGDTQEEGVSGELKRRRTWEDKTREDAAKDGMALHSPKNGVGAGAGLQPRQMI